MKKILMAILGLSLLTTQSCKNAPEGSPAEEMSIASDESGEKVLIRLKPKVGDKQQTLMTMEMDAKEGKAMKMNISGKMDLEVASKEGDLFVYNMKYQSVKVNMDAGGMQFSYDSDKKDQDVMGSMVGKQFEPMLKNWITLKMTDRGVVKEISLKGVNSTKDLGDFGAISLPLPEGPVGVGDSWVSERPMEGMGVLKMKMTLKQITVDDVEILTDGTMVDEKGANIGTFEGSYKLDRNSGLTKDGTMNMKINTEDNDKVDMKINFKTL